jgi:hypothetical protein
MTVAVLYVEVLNDLTKLREMQCAECRGADGPRET